MTRKVHGAITVGQRGAVDACSTIEARTIAGGRLVLLAAVQGQLSTPALEVVKSSFPKITEADAAAAAKLAAAGLPPPFATGIAIVLIMGERAFVATSGAARCYRERGGTLEVLAAGAIDLLPGDTIIGASHPDASSGGSFLAGAIAPPPDDAFHNNGLDDALSAALDAHRGLLAVAVTHVV